MPCHAATSGSTGIGTAQTQEVEQFLREHLVSIVTSYRHVFVGRASRGNLPIKASWPNPNWYGQTGAKQASIILDGLRNYDYMMSRQFWLGLFDRWDG